MQKRILNIYNLVPLILVPSIVWGFDLAMHLLPDFGTNTWIWLLLLTISLPICGYLSIATIYKYFSGRLPNMLPPEIPALVGFIYAQPVYVLLLKLVIDGVYSISFGEAIKAILISTLIVPISTITMSTYDGSLLAVPLTCLSIILAGHRCRKKRGRF